MKNAPCNCGSGLLGPSCCDPFLAGARAPNSPLALMRSRYCAFSKGLNRYLLDTTLPKLRAEIDEMELQRSIEDSVWFGLEIHDYQQNGDQGEVTFSARYAQKNCLYDHHECSTFHLHEGRWYYVSGKAHFRQQKLRGAHPCPCGSGCKYKSCCASKR